MIVREERISCDNETYETSHEWNLHFNDLFLCCHFRPIMATKALKFGPAIKELRLHLCQKSAASKGARDFVEKHYVDLKLANPKFPILVRECSGIEPKAWARFGFGRESSVDLGGKSADEVYVAIAKLEQS